MADRVGQQLGNYRLTRMLGQGGFAEVYLGEHVRLGTQAAVKVLHTRLDDGSEVEHFQQEARTIAHLEHAHIVRVLDYDVQNGVPFLVMGYAPNGNLRQRHPRGSVLPLTTIVSYIKQVAEALQYAHDEKLIHRDIKPENMLLDKHNNILLSDFGIALIAQSSRLQSTQEVAGTAHYMAPEQLQGKPRTASDQYSLGIIVYEWLCGNRPFHGSFTEVASQHVLIPPPPLREKNPTISIEVEQVVQTALHKDPHQRFASVRAFANALDQAHQGKTINLSSSSSPVPLASSTQIPPTQYVKALPAFREQPVEKLPLPPTQPAIITPPISTDPAVPPLSPTQPVEISSLTQSVIVTPPTINEPKRRLAPPQLLITYQKHDFTINVVRWSPDGDSIASAASDGTVQIWDAKTGKRIVSYRGYAKSVTALAWSPDSSNIAFSPGNVVEIWNVKTDKRLVTYKGDFSHIYALAWSPRDSRIAFSSRKTVQVWDAKNDKRYSTFTGHSHWVNVVAWSPDGTNLASASNDGTVQIWSVDAGKRFVTYQGYAYAIVALVWSPDSSSIAFAPGNKVQIWDTKRDELLLTYEGHNASVRVVAWSPDGKYLASAGNDYTVQVWNANTEKRILTYQGYVHSISSLAWSPDSSRIVFSSGNIAQVWEAV